MDELGNLKRTTYCGLLSEEYVGQTVTLMGWVERRRDLGSLIFLDLRDREGVVQVVASPQEPGVLEKAGEIRSEYVISVTGKAVLREKETVNPQLPTGHVEVRAEEIRILNTSETPPFPLSDADSTSEETRLRFRYLDLRRNRMQHNLRLRHRVCLEIRKFLDEAGFLEIETPFLTRSTPEGARDYLVPSRLYPGQFYALPQSPQLFKQLLMVGGFDKYFQIARCFRDEDLRADRQPEFTQLDVEMTYARMETIFDVTESLLQRVFRLLDVDVSLPFPRLTYADAMSRYGTDRPDTRYELELVDVSGAFTETPFRVFQQILSERGAIKGIRLAGAPDYSRKELAELVEVTKAAGIEALSWVELSSQGFKSSLPKAVPVEELEKVKQLADLRPGDLFLMAGGPLGKVNSALGLLRTHLARQEDLIPRDTFSFLWVYEFPLMEWDETQGRHVACNHPFTAPLDQDVELLASSPTRVRAKAYDVVLNGVELGGGSIRIHDRQLQKQVFEALGIDSEAAEEKFGFLLDALTYGAPPHGGIAFGLDRLVMLLAGEQSLRDVIAFPKTARALDLMCHAPAPVSGKQLTELHIRVEE